MAHVRLHVHEFGPGAGRTIVALHGVTGLAQVFRRLADRLPDFRLVAPDLRGHGASGKEPPWDLSIHLRDLRETLDAMGISRAPFIGYSFGGRLAVEMLAADRSRIEKLVLLDPALQMDPRDVTTRTEQLLADLTLLDSLEAEDVVEGSEADEKLTLSSVHQAKGLEYRAVFLIWLADGRFPSAPALRAQDGEEEERRLFYVAVTRAKDELYLTYPMMQEERRPTRSGASSSRTSRSFWRVRELVATVRNAAPRVSCFRQARRRSLPLLYGAR